MIHSGLVILLASHILFRGPLYVHLAFIVLIGEHCELMVSLFVCSFFFQDIHGSSIFHFVSSFFCLGVPFLLCHVSLLSLSLVG